MRSVSGVNRDRSDIATKGYHGIDCRCPCLFNLLRTRTSSQAQLQQQYNSSTCSTAHLSKLPYDSAAQQLTDVLLIVSSDLPSAVLRYWV